MSQATTPAINSSQTPENALKDRARLTDHPIGFWFFFWGEFAERCCYYGMRAILLLYMVQILKFDDSHANRVLSYFIAACYLLPLVGGYVADNFIGKYRTIVYFSIPYIIGQGLLAISALHNETCLFISLGLLAMGSGVIKPNISTLMGLTYDQKRPGRHRLRSDAFAMFYGAINIGAALSSFSVPAVATYFGRDSQAYAIAFMIPTGLMILAFIVFAAGKPFYAVEKISPVKLTPEQRRQRWTVLSRLFGLFLVVTVFWTIFDQSPTTWTLFARDYLHLELFGMTLSPDQLQTVNPILIVLLLPPMTMLWHFLANIGLQLRPTSKMLVGFVLTFVAMAIVTWAGFRGSEVAKRGAPAALAAAEQTASELAKLSQAVEQQAEATPRASAMAAAGLAADEVVRSAAAAVQLAAQLVASGQQAAGNQAKQVAAKQATGKEGTGKEPAENKQQLAGALEGASKSGNSSATTSNPAEMFQRYAAAANAAAARTQARVREAQEAARKERQSAAKAVPGKSSNSANRVAAAAAAIEKAAGAVDRPEVASLHTAIAVLAAADAVVLAAEAMVEESPEQLALLDSTQRDQLRQLAEQTKSAAAQGRLSVWWQIIPYIVITTAEICISVVGLELAFTAAPAAMKSFVTACWLLTVFFANILNAQVTPLYNVAVLGFHLTPGWYFGAFAAAMIPVTLAFVLVAANFNRTLARSGQVV